MVKSEELSIGEIFKTLRLSYGLNQTQLAQKLGVSQGSISKIEKDLLLPPSDILINFAIYYDFSLDIFKDKKLDRPDGKTLGNFISPKYLEKGKISSKAFIKKFFSNGAMKKNKKAIKALRSIGVKPEVLNFPELYFNAQLEEDFQSALSKIKS